MGYKLNTEIFIQKSILKHGIRYNYSKSEYGRNNSDKVIIICNDHGDFSQRPSAHLKGQGCPECYPNNKRSSTENFIQKAILKHGNLYLYNNVDYKTKKEKILITCKKHGDFSQTPNNHLLGHGCPNCKKSKLELYLIDKLDKLNINYEVDKRFKDCRNIQPLSFDFYIESINLLIECDGIQHHKSVGFFGGDSRYEYQMKNDSIKNKYCVDNEFNLIRIRSNDDIIKFIDSILKGE